MPGKGPFGGLSDRQSPRSSGKFRNHNLEEKLWNCPHLSAQGNSPFAANPCALVSRLTCGASYPQAESYPQRKVQVLLNS